MHIIKKATKIIDYLFSVKFFRYCLCGGVSAITDLSIFFVLNELFKIYYLYALVISFAIAAVVNYVLQRKITFKNTYSKKHKQFTVFMLIQLVGLAINAIATAGQVELLGMWPTLARFIAIWIALIFNYSANKKITFKLMKGDSDGK